MLLSSSGWIEPLKGGWPKKKSQNFGGVAWQRKELLFEALQQEAVINITSKPYSTYHLSMLPPVAGRKACTLKILKFTMEK
jgi:hypothetical protein